MSQFILYNTSLNSQRAHQLLIVFIADVIVQSGVFTWETPLHLVINIAMRLRWICLYFWLNRLELVE